MMGKRDVKVIPHRHEVHVNWSGLEKGMKHFVLGVLCLLYVAALCTYSWEKTEYEERLEITSERITNEWDEWVLVLTLFVAITGAALGILGGLAGLASTTWFMANGEE